MNISPQSKLSGLPPVTAATPPRFNPMGVRILVGVILLALLVNVGFILTIQQNDQPTFETRSEQSKDISLIGPIDANRLLTATIQNELILLEGGQPVVAPRKFDLLIGGLAALPETIYVGTADGKITALDYTLENPRDIATVDGRIVGMKALGDSYVVAHGIGPFSDRYWVTLFKDGETEPVFKTQVEFTIAAVDAADGFAFYGTANAKIGAISLETGEKIWSITGKRPVTRLLALSAGQVAVGDEKGNITLLDNQGNTVWSVNVTQYQIRGMTADESTSTILAGDGEGNLFALDMAGNLLVSRQVADDDLEALFDFEPNNVIVVPRNGQWTTVHPAALTGAGIVDQLRSTQVLADIGLVVAILAAIVVAVERFRLSAVRTLRQAWRTRIAYILIFPALVCVIVWNYLPAGMAAYYSLTNKAARNTTVEFIGLKNYEQILTRDEYFGIGFKNVLIITIANLVKVVTAPLLVAELIFWLKTESRRYLFRTLYLLPAVVPGLIGVYMWTMVYDPYDGLLNQILKAFFGIPTGRAWLADETLFLGVPTALWAIIFAGFPFVSAFPLLIYMGGLLNINAELFDAARIDGASWWTRFTRIDIPLLSPQFRLLLFFSFSGALAGFADIVIFTNGGPGIATFVPGLQMYRKISEGEFGYASALGGVLFVLVFIGTLVIVRSRRDALAEV